MAQGSSTAAENIKRLGGNAIATGAGDVTNGTLRVHLSTESLAALENISITVPGTVDLGEVSLTALETITVEQSDASKFLATAKLSDGTNLGTIKAASTAAVAGDTALVVAISPNNTVAATQSGTWNVGDGGGSLTVDGTVAATQSGTWTVALDVDSLLALETISVTGTVAVTDNDGSLTVDGTVAATQSGSWTVALDEATLTALETITVGGTIAATQSGTWDIGTVTSITNAVAVTDNSGSLTVDAPVGTPVYVRLSDGANAVDTLPVSLSVAAKSNETVSAYAASLVVKASAGTLYMINGYNASTSDQWIQLHDASSLPADGSAPKLTFLAPAESNFYFDFGLYGRAFGTGIVVCNSSTGPTKTIGSANCWFDAQFA